MLDPRSPRKPVMTDARSTECDAIRDDVRKLYLAVEVLSKALAGEGLIDARFLGNTRPLFDRIEALEARFTPSEGGPVV